MNKVFQYSKDLIDPIKTRGCNYLSLIGIIVDFSKHTFNEADINAAYFELKDKKALTEKAGVMRPDLVFKHFFNLAGVKMRGYQIGSNIGFWVSKRQQRVDATIIRFKTKYKGEGYGEHYMQGRSDGKKAVYDPANGTLEIGIFLGYYCYRIDVLGG